MEILLGVWSFYEAYEGDQNMTVNTTSQWF